MPAATRRGLDCGGHRALKKRVRMSSRLFAAAGITAHAKIKTGLKSTM